MAPVVCSYMLLEYILASVNFVFNDLTQSIESLLCLKKTLKFC